MASLHRLPLSINTKPPVTRLIVHYYLCSAPPAPTPIALYQILTGEANTNACILITGFIVLVPWSSLQVSLMFDCSRTKCAARVEDRRLSGTIEVIFT